MSLLGLIGLILVLWATWKLLGVVFRLVQGLVLLGIGLYLLQRVGVIRSIPPDAQGIISRLWVWSQTLWQAIGHLVQEVLR